MTKLRLVVGVALSFVVASALNVYPLSFELARYRPMMLCLMLIFWAMYQPRLVGIGVAFIIGIISDLLLDTRLGYQAFSAVASIFVLRILIGYTKRLDFLSAWILAGVSLTIYRVLLWIFESFGAFGFIWVGFRGYVVSLLIFPLLWQVLTMLFAKYNQEYQA